jgi:hypothetical protein
MSDAGRIVCHPSPADVTSEQASDARARAWAFVFRCWQEKQKAAKRTPTPDGSNERNEQVKLAKEAAMT